MKRNLLVILIAGISLMMFTGCAGTKKTYARGWIGGEYLEASNSLFKKISDNYFKSDKGVIPTLPDGIPDKQSSAVFVSRIFDHTPLSKAGIQAGDLILAIDGREVEDLKDLRQIVDRSTPGEKLHLTIYRDGKTMVLPVLAGKETYQKWHYFSLGFRLASELDPIPTPDFNILGVISFEKNNTRLELNSPEYRYYRQAKAYPPEKSESALRNDTAAEGWDAWFVIFGLSGKTIILSQES
jgi:membrane-associated protease RseP (regulator of RpoE activity)